jgi:tetratricopeptide (TPR) repeat protein
VERLRAALERYEFTPAGGPVSDVAVVRRRLAHAWAAFEFANYQVMGSLLPGLLDDAQRTHEAVGSPESGVLLSEVYQLIASTLRKLGEHTLAWLAGDRGVTVAQRCGDLAAVAGAGFRIANALLSMGRAEQALALNLSLADRVEPQARQEAMRALYGHVMLQAAMAAAAAGEDRRAVELIAEARQAAQFVSSDHFRLAFGPVNVSLHEVAALVALGENRRALAAADAISEEDLRRLRKERRAALLVDTARACSQAGDRDEAVRRLVAAEQIAASEVRCRPLAQATIADLLHRSRGAPSLALASLAGRAGVRA